MTYWHPYRPKCNQNQAEVWGWYDSIGVEQKDCQGEHGVFTLYKIEGIGESRTLNDLLKKMDKHQ